MATAIVSAYLVKNTVSPAELPALLREVHNTLQKIALNGAGLPRAEATPAVSIKRSVSKDHVTCLVCGIELQSLKRHLGSKHDLTPDAYRAKFGLPAEHPIVAPSYSETRSRLAVRSGLGRKAAARTPRR